MSATGTRQVRGWLLTPGTRLFPAFPSHRRALPIHVHSFDEATSLLRAAAAASHADGSNAGGARAVARGVGGGLQGGSHAASPAAVDAGGALDEALAYAPPQLRMADGLSSDGGEIGEIGEMAEGSDAAGVGGRVVAVAQADALPPKAPAHYVERLRPIHCTRIADQAECERCARTGPRSRHFDVKPR